MISKGMLITLVLYFIPIANLVLCQETGSKTTITKPSTRGLFIGISDYKNFPKLNYAHKDAAALHYFFEEKAHLSWCKLLTNQSATYDSIVIYLTTLYEEAVEGDTVIIFLSGHGDVQNVFNERGYFLGHDTNKNYYNLNGVSFNEVNDALIGLRAKKVKVYFFVDACRAGMINKVNNGPSLSLAGIMMSNDELVKFASCQKNQVSMEYGSLGGGHGLFTFCLLNGLTCSSDMDYDKQVSYEELRRYLYDNIQKISNKAQTPMANNISNAEFSILFCEEEEETIPVINRTFKRPNAILENANNQIDTIYKQVIDCIKQKRLVSPADSCAYFFYEKLQANASPSMKPKTQVAKRLLRSALEKFIDDLILSYSNDNKPEFSQEEIKKALLSSNTIKKLSPEDYWLNTRNRSRYYFFKSFDVISPDLKNTYNAIAYLDSARVIDVDGAHNYFALGVIYVSLEKYFEADNYFIKIKEIADETNLYRQSLKWRNQIYNIVESRKNDYNALHFSGNSQQILFVKKGSAGNGSSWNQAFGDLQQALQIAKPGTEIWVAAGIYNPTNLNNRNTSFVINSGISLLGGFIGKETNRAQRDWAKNQTILSGNIGDPTSSEDNSFNIVHTRNVTQVLVDGFIIKDGNASNSNEKEQEGHYTSTGAAWYDEASQGVHAVRIQNCSFQDNKANYAAGIYCLGVTGGKNKTEIINCSFIQNNAQVEGGAAMLVANGGECRVLIEKSRFIDNFALYGGAIFTRAINNGINNSAFSLNTLQNNNAYIDGADFFNNRDNSSINKSIFVSNVSSNTPSQSNILDEVKMTPNTVSRMRPSSKN